MPSRDVLLIIVSLAAVGVIGVYFTYPYRFVDFPVYYYSGQSLLAGRTDLYVPSFSIGVLMTYRYPPFFLLFFYPLWLIPYSWASYIWFWLCAGQIAGCVFFVKRLVENAGAKAKAAFDKTSVRAALFFALAQYFVISVKYGNAHLLVVFLFFGSLYFLEKQKTIRAALLMALGITFKLVPVLALPYFALKKKWTYLILTAVFVAAMNLAPAFYFGFDKNLQILGDWYNHVVTNQDAHEKLTIINLSLRGELQRALTRIDYSRRDIETGSNDVDYENVNFASLPDHIPNGIWAVASAVLYAGSLFLIWSKSRSKNGDAASGTSAANRTIDDKQNRAFEYSLITCLILLIGPLTTKIYFPMLLLPVACLANYGFASESFSAKIARRAVLVTAIANFVLPLVPGRAAQRLILVLGADFYITLLLTTAIIFVLATRKNTVDAKTPADAV